MPYKKYLKQLLPIDIATLGYIVLTALYIIFGAGNFEKIATLIGYRLLFVMLIGLFIHWNTLTEYRFVRFVRHFYPLILLLYFYPETDAINNFLFHNLDPLVANLEVTLFGAQPSLLFSHALPWRWFSELMSFGYFSYFPMIFLFCYLIYKKNYERFSYVIFVIGTSFFLYYFIFILFPVAGPQFYFPKPENQVPDGYFFSHILRFIQEVGERPTAAFPSSHVGVMTLLLILVYKIRPKLLKWYLPMGVLLYFSTVYIKAHYVIDVIAGFLTVPSMYWITSRIFSYVSNVLEQEYKLGVVFRRVRTSILYLLSSTKRK